MAAPALDVAVRPNPRAVFRELTGDAGGVVLHLDTAAYHGVNAFGAYVWGLLAGGPTFAALLDTIRAEVDGAPADLEGEVGAFLSDLHERGLVVYGGEA
jgi:hypothetical protein